MILHSTTLGLPNCPIEIHYSIIGSSKLVEIVKIQGCWIGTQELAFNKLPQDTQDMIFAEAQRHAKALRGISVGGNKS